MSDNKEKETATLRVVGSERTSELDASIAKEQARQAVKEKGSMFMSGMMASSYGLKNDIAHVPFASPHQLLDDVSNDSVLGECISFKARTIGGLGFHTKMFKVGELVDEIDESTRAAFEEFVKGLFFPSIETVATRAFYDYEYSGMGAVLVDTNLVVTSNDKATYLGQSYDVVRHEVVRIRHLNRIKVIVLQPRVDKRGGIESGYELDLMFPRMFVHQEPSGFYAKSFGDPRMIDRKTGNVIRKAGSETSLAPMIYRFTQYYPLDEIYGFPAWRTAKLDIDTIYDIRTYDHHHFRGSGVPNLVFIVPDVKTESGEDAASIVEKFLVETSEQRKAIGGEAGPKAIVLSVPLGSIHQSSGKFPIMIKEIGGSAPSGNIELRNELSQSIITANSLPANLIFPYTRAVGSGKDKREDLRQYKEFYAEPLRKSFNSEFLDKIFQFHTKNFKATAHLNEIDTKDREEEAKIAKLWDSINVMNAGEKREKIGVLRPVYPEDVDKSKEFNRLVFIDFNRVPWDWETMERPDMRLKDLEASLDEMQSQIDDAQDGNGETDEAKRFIASCNEHGIPVEYFTRHVIPSIKSYLEGEGKE